MIKIEEMMISNSRVTFYDEIDFDVVLEHPKNGTEGIIVCLVTNFYKSISEYNRSVRIDNILDSILNQDLRYTDIENKYVMIFQCDDIPKDKMLETIIKKLEIMYLY